MSSSDEDDKFLYGSDTEQAELGSKRVSKDDDGALNKRQKVSNENTEKDSSSDSSQGEDNDSESSESESDSDVEFIISTGTDSSRLDSATASGATTTAAQPSGITLATAPVETPAQVTEDGTTLTKTDASLVPPSGTIDLEAEGMYEGQPVTSLDPEVLKEKPWRQPGANLSDYFNYGFNEFTWMEYLHKQEKLQQEYNPHKILMGLLTLQQQGNLNGPKAMANSGDINNSGGIKSNTPINQHVPGHPMMAPGFPPLPMFGGFPFPGMMPPVNQQQKK